MTSIEQIKEAERVRLIDENIELHNQLYKAREEIKKLKGTILSLLN